MMAFDPHTLDPQQQAAYDEAMSRFPELVHLKQLFNRYAIRVTGVVMPQRLRIPYDGDDADPTFTGTMMGLPITWSEKEEWGLISHLAEGRKDEGLPSAYRL